jgi:hypothetical protein
MDCTLHGFNDVRQTKIHTVEPPVSDSGAYEVDMTITKVKIHQSHGTDQISAELAKTRGRTIALRSINLLIRFGIRRNCLRSGRSQTMYLFIRRAIKQTVVIIEAYRSCQVRQNVFRHPTFKVNSLCRGNYWGSLILISMQQINYCSYNLH